VNFKTNSPVTGIEYTYPDDAKNDFEISAFVDRNKSMGRKIVGVVGLGFVGAATSTMVGDSDLGDFAVIGFDLEAIGSFWKIGDFNNAMLPLNCGDKNLDEAFLRAFEQDKLIATGSFKHVKDCDILMIAINLDVRKKYDVSGNLAHEVLEEPYLECIENIAQYLDEKTLLILESTLPVGFTENKVQPIIQSQFSERGIEIDQILLGHSYERVTPGKNYLNSMKNFYRVYSGVNDASKLATRNFLKLVVNTTDFELTELESPRASEMAKLLENSYRSMNIAFAVEWSRFAESMCVNLYEVVDAVRKRPTHANLMYPGIGVGGYCLTKDGLIADRSFESGSLPMTVNAVVESDHMPSYALNFVKSKLSHLEPINSCRAIIAGVAYAPGVGDTRFSPVEKFAVEISKEFSEVYYVDPYVSYWEEMDVPIQQNFDKITTMGFENIFVCTKHTEFYEMLNSLPSALKKVINLYDLVGLYQNPQNRPQKDMFKNYFLLGSG